MLLKFNIGISNKPLQMAPDPSVVMKNDYDLLCVTSGEEQCIIKIQVAKAK